jgi:hypothetical protein
MMIPILVTGAHRSGTTWVGKMLAASGEATYISEPLNCWHRPGVMSAPIRYWYTYICDLNETEYLWPLRQTLELRYHTWLEIKSIHDPKDFLRMLRDGSNFISGRLMKKRPLLKDPFAVFSAPWFAERFGCQVVVVTRHPAAFASSLKRLGWNFNFKDLLEQPLLMEHWLEPYRGEMEEALKDPGDIIGKSSLLWWIIYQVVSQLQDKYPSFRIVRHEDLSSDPTGSFEALYRDLGLRFSSRARESIARSSSSENPKEISKRNIYATRLDSRGNLENWRLRLDTSEIKRIRQVTEELATRFYPEFEWG